MADLVTALALVFVIEGALYALFPTGMRNLVVQMMEASDTALRRCGFVAVIFGVFIVWMIRG